MSAAAAHVQPVYSESQPARAALALRGRAEHDNGRHNAGSRMAALRERRGRPGTHPVVAAVANCARSGNPMSRVRCSGGSGEARERHRREEDSAQRAEREQSTPDKAYAHWAQQSAEAISPHSASSVRLAESGEWISGITGAAWDTRWIIVTSAADDSRAACAGLQAPAPGARSTTRGRA